MRKTTPNPPVVSQSRPARGRGMLAAAALACLAFEGAMAAERVFTCRNWVDRDWPRTLLHYDIEAQPGEFVPGKVELADAASVPVECQVEAVEKHADGSLKKGRVSFYADLKKDAAWSHTLKSAASPKAFAARVTAQKKGDAIEVASAEAGVRIPAPGERTFKTPAAPKDVPAPILGWRLADGKWAGKSWIESDRLVTGWSQRVVADGPLYKEYEYEVRFAPGAPPRDTEGYYRARVRIEAEQPLVFVAEEFDFGCITAGKDALMMVLSDGWQPDTAVWSANRAPAPAQQLRATRTSEFDVNAWRGPLHGESGQPAANPFSLAAVSGAPFELGAVRQIATLWPWQDFGTGAQWYGMFGEAGDPGSPFVGLFTRHAGAWRLTGKHAPRILGTDKGLVLARLPISLPLSGFVSNPFNTGEMDPDLPQTLGRRLWALALGPRPAVREEEDPNTKAKTAKTDISRLDGWRDYLGFITLDDYKDWVLNWPATPNVMRPRVFTTPADLARLKANLDRCPGRDVIQNYSLITGDAKTAQAEGEQALRWLGEGTRLLNSYIAHYRQTQSAYAPAFHAESALASPALPEDLRRRLQAHLAFFCYLYTHADVIPRGAAFHMGNPNMPINRAMVLPLYAGLIPDHPKAGEWMEEARRYLEWKAEHNIAAGGGMFRENQAYTVYGPSIFMTTAAVALRNNGYDIGGVLPALKELASHLNAIDTPATLTRAPRPNYADGPLKDNRKVRVLPGLMGGRDVPGGQTRMMLANLTAKSDPAFAAAMMGAFHEAGAFLGTEMIGAEQWFHWNPDVAPKTPARDEQIFAGLGGILRAHVGTPEEAYFALRMGYSQQRGTDQGAIALYAYGANLIRTQGAHDPAKGLWRHPVVVYGEPSAEHEHGRVDTNIEDYGFLPSVGYLLGRQTYKGRLEAIEAFRKRYPGVEPDLIWDKQFQLLKDDFIRSRQVVMLRPTAPAGPTYYVMRDTTQGECPLPTRWHLALTASADNVKPIPGGVRATALQDPAVKLDVLFVEPANPEVAILAEPPDHGDPNAYAQIRIAQGAGKGYLTVLYPYREGAPTPQSVEHLGDGIVRIVTAEATDYVFCAVDQPVVFKDAVIDINAMAGAVRVFKDKVLLVNAAGQQGAVGYKGVVAQGVGPFEHATQVNPGKAETVAAGRKAASVAQPEGEGTLIAVDGSGKSENTEVTGAGLKGWILINGDTVTYAMAEGFGRVGYRDFWIQGEAPFTLVHAPGKMTLTTEGRRRIFQMPIPLNIVPPNMLPPEETLPYDYRLGRDIGGFRNWPWSVVCTVNGRERMIGWYDGKIALGLDDGKQEAVITRFTNPPVWKASAWTRLLP